MWGAILQRRPENLSGRKFVILLGQCSLAAQPAGSLVNTCAALSSFPAHFCEPPRVPDQHAL
jgi:hypothetical protein